MSTYKKLGQACCDYGCVGTHIPEALKVGQIFSGGTWGPGYEDLNPGRIRCPYDNGPLSMALGMRCEWQGTWAGLIGCLIQRHCQDAQQTKFQVQARMDWPAKGAWASFNLVPPAYFDRGPCGEYWEIPLDDYASLDGLMTPPTDIRIYPWFFSDVPLPPP